MMQSEVNLTESKGTLNIDIANYNFQTAFLRIVILWKTPFNKAVGYLRQWGVHVKRIFLMKSKIKIYTCKSKWSYDRLATNQP